MLWTAAAVGAALVFLLLFVGTPVRRAIALTIAAQRACRRRDYAAAERSFRDAQATAAKIREPRKSLIQSQIEIAQSALLYRQGKMRQAEDMLRRGFSRTRAAGCHERMKPAYAVWGDLCTDEGRHLEAERHYRMALEGDEQAGDRAGMILDLQRLGDSLLRQERREEAEEAIHRAMALESGVAHAQMARQGKDPGAHRVICWSLPDLHFCRGQYEEAGRLYREKIAHWEKSAARPDNVDLGQLQMRLAMAEERSGRREEALAMYTRAEKTFAREWCEGHPKVAAAREAHAALAREGATVAGEWTC